MEITPDLIPTLKFVQTGYAMSYTASHDVTVLVSGVNGLHYISCIIYMSPAMHRHGDIHVHVHVGLHIILYMNSVEIHLASRAALHKSCFSNHTIQTCTVPTCTCIGTYSICMFMYRY